MSKGEGFLPLGKGGTAIGKRSATICGVSATKVPYTPLHQLFRLDLGPCAMAICTLDSGTDFVSFEPFEKKENQIRKISYLKKRDPGG